MPDFIDPVELPFTAEELFDAFCRFMPADEARDHAESFASAGPEIIALRAEQHAEDHKVGAPSADSMWLGAWGYPDELMPALASLSPEVEARARGVMEHEWNGLRLGSINRQQREAAVRAGIVPSIEELIRQAKRAAESNEDTGRLNSGLAVRLPPLPPPTPEMEAAAEARVAEKRLAWEREVARFRQTAATG